MQGVESGGSAKVEKLEGRFYAELRRKIMFDQWSVENKINELIDKYNKSGTGWQTCTWVYTCSYKN